MEGSRRIGCEGGAKVTALHLVIGNKNYSSWSLRPWIALTMAGIPFTETVVLLDRPDTKRNIAQHSKAGRVPVLHHGKLVIWESLAILEYLAEAFPKKNLWPKSRAARAVARSVCNEMHAGFSALRTACPMNLRRPRKPISLSEEARADCRRIEEIWLTCRKQHGGRGKFLFGRFTNTDAMFAPVVARFDTYAIKVAADTRAYMEAMLSTPAFRAWQKAALSETEILLRDEVS